MLKQSTKNLSLEAWGIISRTRVKANFYPNTNQGLRFISPQGKIINISINNLISTQRNTVIGQDDDSICLVEHLLAALALSNLDNLDISLSENEVPFGDGSAQLWIDFFRTQNLISPIKQSSINLKEEIIITDENDPSKYIEIKKSNNFKLSYILDWPHPLIGKQEYTWSLGDFTDEIAKARTFSNETENQILGLSGKVIGLTESSFTHDLHFPNEPCRHKALDLLGDLMLSEINPLKIKMHIISHKGGHELNSKASRFIYENHKCKD